MANTYATAGKQVGEAFTKGWNNGVADFNGTPQSTSSTTGAVGKAFGSTTTGTATKITADKDTKKTSDNITGGGRQVRNNYITVSKMGVDNLTLQSVNVKEGIGEIRDILLREFLQLLNAANQMQ